MIDRKKLSDYLLSMPNSRLDYPFGEDVAVYKTAVAGSDKMFALVPERGEPLKVSLKCDPQLAEVLREKYESVMPGYHLNKKHWNTIVLSGQIEWPEIQVFITHSYNLVTGKH